MLTRVCDICGRIITDDVAVVVDERELYNKCSPRTIGITCPKDFVWDLCPSCKEKLYSWVQERREEAAVEELKRAALKESFDAEDKEWGTMEERCHEEAVMESAPQIIQRIRSKIFEAKRELRKM